MALKGVAMSRTVFRRLFSSVICQERYICSYSCSNTPRNAVITPYLHSQGALQVPNFGFSQLRRLHERKSASYDPDGKTTVQILNQEAGAPLMIDTYNQQGFRLNNGMKVLGPIAIFPKTVLSWNVGRIEHITPESLSLFAVLEPKPDVLVLGIGDQGAQLPLETIQYLRKKRINMEILATIHACTTFNFLSAEGRCVAGAMIPPFHITWTQRDAANTKLEKSQLYAQGDIDE